VISSVGNRDHTIVFRAKRLNDDIGTTQHRLGVSGSASWGTYVTPTDKSWTTQIVSRANLGAAGFIDMEILFQHQMGTDDPDPAKVLCLDNIVVIRELAAPEVTEFTGAGNSWTLVNEGGENTDAKLIAFDPDVTVSLLSGYDVGTITTTWDSDNQLSLSFENALAGSTTLRVTNPYGAQTFDITLIPEPTTLGLLACGAVGLIRRKSNFYSKRQL
jgi:hypothetical protein